MYKSRRFSDDIVTATCPGVWPGVGVHVIPGRMSMPPSRNLTKSLMGRSLSLVIISAAIHALPSDEYVLNEPLNVILEIYDDEVLALLPELKLFGEGDNEIEALDDLKSELLDLIEDLESIPDHKLGKDLGQEILEGLKAVRDDRGGLATGTTSGF